MNIFDWLKSKSELKLSDDNSYVVIIEERGWIRDNEWNDVDDDARQLMLADLYVMLYSYPSQITHSLGSQGFSQSESMQNGKRDSFLSLALGIYKELDKSKYDKLNEQGSKIGGLNRIQSW